MGQDPIFQPHELPTNDSSRGAEASRPADRCRQW